MKQSYSLDREVKTVYSVRVCVGGGVDGRPSVRWAFSLYSLNSQCGENGTK